MLLLLGLLGTSACVASGDDLHLAPIYSSISRAGGGREIEAIAGAVRIRRPAPGAEVNEWALRPFISKEIYGDEDSLTRFIVPLGHHRKHPDESVTQLLPLFRYDHRTLEDGKTEWQFFALPGIFWAKRQDGRVVRAVFPFGGVIEDFFTYDRITFALFPLFAKTTRGEMNSWHFLFPIFNWRRGPGGSGTRFFPFWGHSERDDSWSRSFALWPIIHWHRNNLDQPEAEQETQWMVFPLLGRTRRGTFRSTSVLWPFFGYSRDEATGFWAWDGPWPLVRWHGGGDNPPSEIRRRLWPFWSHYRGDGLDSRWYGFPFFNLRTHEYPDEIEKASYLVPIWQRWRRWNKADPTGDPIASFHKIWPLYQRSFRDGKRRKAIPALNPLWFTPVLDDHYAWIWELYTTEDEGPIHRERSWGGIYKRELDLAEDRRYVTGIWSWRTYQDEGARVEETSLLFGLIRFRSHATDGLEWLAPALPGPGFPAHRAPVPEALAGPPTHPALGATSPTPPVDSD